MATIPKHPLLAAHTAESVLMVQGIILVEPGSTPGSRPHYYNGKRSEMVT